MPRRADEGREQRREGAPPAAEAEAPANRSAGAAAEAPRPIVPLAPGTIEALTGRGGDVASISRSAAAVAAEARIRWVLEQYAGAFERHDAGLAGTYRPALSADERSWIAAGARVTVRFDQLRVEASETDGTVHCRRVVRGTTESGSAVRDERAVVVTLVRRPAGWVITDIR